MTAPTDHNHNAPEATMLENHTTTTATDRQADTTTAPTVPWHRRPATRTFAVATLAAAAVLASTIGTVTAVSIADSNARARVAAGAVAIGDTFAWHGDPYKRLEADLAQDCRTGIKWTCAIQGVERAKTDPSVLIAHSNGTLPGEQIPEVTHSTIAARILAAAPVGVERVTVVSPAGVLGSAATTDDGQAN